MDSGNPQTSMDHFYRGRQRYADGDFDGAIADYTESLRLEPGNIITLATEEALGA